MSKKDVRSRRRVATGESPTGTLWRPGWNTLRARITGNPPHITTWLNGEMVVDFQDTEHRLPDRGAIALQVHGGDRHNTGTVRFRNLRVQPLDWRCINPDVGRSREPPRRPIDRIIRRF